jgi:uncharacterized membrane protein
VETSDASSAGEFAEWALLLAAGCAALIFIAVGIRRPVWLDEANSVLIAARGFGGIVDSLRHDNNLPCYYSLLCVWMRVFGDSEIALRALSAVFYLGGCGAVFLLGKRASGDRRRGFYSAFFYGVSPLAIRQAQNIRMYALLGLLTALSTYFFLRIFQDEDRSRGALAALIAVDAIGCLTHVWFIFVLMAQFAALVFAARPPSLKNLGRFAGVACVAGVPFAVLWAPIFLAQLRNGATDWMPKLQPGVLTRALFDYYGPLAAAALFALLVAGLLARGGERPRLPGSVRSLTVIFGVCIAAPLLVSLVKPIYWPGRYTIIALPALAALLGSVLPAITPRPLLVVVCIALLAFQAVDHVANRASVPESTLPAGQSDKTTAEFLLGRAAAGDAIVFTSLTRAAADYYFRRAGAAGRFVEINFPAEVAAHLGWMSMALTPDRSSHLETESALTCAALERVAARGGTVWLYDGYAPSITGILKQKLDLALTLRNRYALQGSFHTSLLEYGSRVEQGMR